MRRETLSGNAVRVALLSVAMVVPACGAPSEPALEEAYKPAFVQSTFTYKQVGETRIEADVYRHDDDRARPVLVWIHGGALMFGSRAFPPYRLLDLCRVAGCAVVSIDYRLAPDETLPAIIEDLEDAFAWIREEGPALFAADPDRIVVAGGSAGGYLTLASGYRVQPRPAALVSFWGYGALNTFDAEPSEHYRTSQPLVTEEEAWSEGGNLYLYLRQNGLWTHVVAGFDPVTEYEQLTEYAPVDNVTADYPPTLLIHGDADNDVPFEESVTMAKALARNDVTHELMLVPNGSHGLGRGDSQSITEAYAQALAFAHAHLFGETRAAEIGPLVAAHAALDAGVQLAREDDIDGALAAFARASELESGATIPGSAWALVCRRGGLLARAADVLEACNRAVELWPDNRGYRSARGVVRALLGDLEGAGQDLKPVIEWIQDPARRARQQAWVDEVRAGRNPFTPEVLESLRAR